MTSKSQETVLCVLTALLALFSCSQSWTYCYDAMECSGDTITDDHVLCYGHFGCWSATIDCDALWAYGSYAAYRSIVDASLTADCDGPLACAYTSVTADGHIGCDGRRSCLYAEITSNDDEVTCGGESACSGAHVTAYGGVTCQGYQSCRFSDIQTTYGDIECDGEESCYISSLIALNDYSVNCNGRRACVSSDIREVGGTGPFVVNCDGYASCYRTVITDVGLVSVYGAYGLEEGRVFVNGVFDAYFHGYMATANARIVCYEGSRCDIRCLSDTACQDLTVECWGVDSCKIQCGFTCEQDIYCEDENESSTPQKCPTVTYPALSSALSSSAKVALQSDSTSSEMDELRKKVKTVADTFGVYVKKVLTEDVGETAESVEQGKGSFTDSGVVVPVDIQSLIGEKLTEVNDKIETIGQLFEKKMELIEKWNNP